MAVSVIAFVGIIVVVVVFVQQAPVGETGQQLGRKAGERFEGTELPRLHRFPRRPRDTGARTPGSPYR
jgi:hypothetical protein